MIERTEILESDNEVVTPQLREASPDYKNDIVNILQELETVQISIDDVSSDDINHIIGFSRDIIQQVFPFDDDWKQKRELLLKNDLSHWSSICNSIDDILDSPIYFTVLIKLSEKICTFGSYIRLAFGQVVFYNQQAAIRDAQ